MNDKLRLKAIILVIAVFIGLIAAFAVLTGFLSESDERKIGFVMTGSVDEQGWNGMNYDGIKAVCDDFGIELLIKENIPEGENLCSGAIAELAADGAEMIILSSYGYPEEVRDIIGNYPEIAFYGNSAEYYEDNMTSYFGRMYQARYLSGIIAGMQTESDIIGYVAAMPNSEVNRGINAFTLGVRRVNPEAAVVVVWTDTWNDEGKEMEAAYSLIENAGADLLAYHQNQPYVIDAAEELGVYSIGYNEAFDGYSEKHLTAAVWNWELLYKDIVKDFMQGKANLVQHHWCGIETGAVGLSEYSSLVSEEARSEVEKAKAEILSGNDVFSGEIYDNNGVLRCGIDEVISDSFLMSEFDWYVEGVSFYEE